MADKLIRQRNLIRKRRNQRKIMAIVMVTILVIIGTILLAKIYTNTIKGNDGTHKEYFVVEVQAQDTLWDLSCRFNNTDMNIIAYIDAVQEINDIVGDRIYPGEKLLLPVLVDQNNQLYHHSN